jgi:hypothetical protein
MKGMRLVAGLVFLAGCSTLVQKSGDFLDGAGGETLETYRCTGEDKKTRAEIHRVLVDGGEEILEIESAAFPGFRLRSTLPAENGEIEFTSLEFLSSHYHGWNEFSLALLGRGAFVPEGDGLLLKIAEAPERIQISSGRIRLKESRLTGSEALTALRNRRERILALTEWMSRPSSGPEGGPAGSPESGPEEEAAFKDQGSFEQYWKPLLFPELVSGKKRPQGWQGENDVFIRADGIKWNRFYTERVFPEGLWEYRNSGALFRDWEEGAAWIYMEYAWDSILFSFNEMSFTKLQ